MKRGGSCGNSAASALGHDVGKLVFGDLVPHIEKEKTVRPQDPARLLVALNLVGKEHHAELAGHRIEALILKRQCQGIGMSPFDPDVG